MSAIIRQALEDGLSYYEIAMMLQHGLEPFSWEIEPC